MACLEACAAAGIPVVVLDRPNPLGGDSAEGPLLDLHYASFVGRAAFPMRHGLTMGELAQWLNEQHNIRADLSVVKMSGWLRRMLWPETGRTWVVTSPNLPRRAALFPSGSGSFARGTAYPKAGHDHAVPGTWRALCRPVKSCSRAEPYNLTGLRLRPVRDFLPTFHKWRDKSCGGLYLHVTDPQDFSRCARRWRLITTIRQLARFAWRDPPYEYKTISASRSTSSSAIAGSPRRSRSRRSDAAALDDLLFLDKAGWRKGVAEHLLYGDS